MFSKTLARVVPAICLATAWATAGPIGLIRSLNSPIVPAANSNTTFHGRHAFNPSVVLFNGTYFLYFRGEDQNGNQSIGVWTASSSGFNGTSWNQTPTSEPVITDGNLADPCAVVYKNQIYLYYMGAGGGSYLATSSDGLHFTLQGHILNSSGQNTAGDTPCPFVNSSDGKLYLFVTTGNGKGNGYEYMVMNSSDGLHFGSWSLAVAPSFLTGTVDAQSISTIRIYQEGSYYYAIYGASSVHDDYNEGFGLARSTDLVNWTKYPKNPIFLRGPAGSGDEGAVWSGSLIKAGSVYYLYYEGCGSNAGAGTSASNTARSTEYGGWASTNFSQVWLATSSSLNLTDWDSNGDLAPGTTFEVKNNSQALDVNGGPTSNGAGLFLNTTNGGSTQQWQFTPSAGFYQISNLNGGPSGYQVWDVGGQSVLNGAGVDQWPSWGGANQQWQVVPVSGGYAFKNRNSGDVLDLSGGNAVQNPWSGTSSQQWSLQSIGSNTVNYVVNPSFEASGAGATGLDWSVWSGNGTASASYTESGAHSGSYRMTNYSSSPFQVYTSQNLYGIPNGTYTLSAWVTGGGGQSASYLSAKHIDGSGEVTQDVRSYESGWPNWQKVTLSNINVTQNSLTVGVYTYDSSGNTWVSFDDFELIPQ
jgi:hypothetical protein